MKTEFEVIQMKESDSIDDFVMRLTAIANKIRTLFNRMEQAYIVKKFLHAMSEKFLAVVSTIEAFGNVDNMLLEEAIRLIKAHEERVRIYRENDFDHLLLTHDEW